MSDSPTQPGPAGAEPPAPGAQDAAAKQQRQMKIIVAAIAGPVLLLAVALVWLSWSPGLAIKNPSPAALTPADCSVFVHAPNLGRNLRYLGQKQAVQQFAKSGAPGKFVEIVLRPKDPEKGKQAAKSAGRMVSFAASDASLSSCPTPGARAGAPNELLVVSRLGFSQRILFNLGKGSGSRSANKQGKFKVYKAGLGGRTFHVTLAGGYLIAATHRGLVNRALDLGMAKDSKSMAAADFYRKSVESSDKSERLVAEWFAPHGAFKSSLTHAKLDYGRITAGGGGVTVNFISRAHSKAAPGGSLSMDPSKYLPASVSLLMVTRSFGRVWQDLLIGKAMSPDETETFMQELYGFGLGELAEYFEDGTGVALDGVYREGDGTPVPSLVFIYKAADKDKAREKVYEILRKSIQDDYEDRKVLRNQMEYITFKNDYDETAVTAPSFALVDDFVFFTLTDTQMERILDAAAGVKPALSGTAAYKALFKTMSGKQDAFILVQGKPLGAQAVDYFTWFGDISSPELAQALQQAVVPAARMLEHSGGGAGSLVYKDGLLYGALKVFHAPQEKKR